MNEQLRPINTGQERAAARLAAIIARNTAIAAGWPERQPSRQVVRRLARAKPVVQKLGQFRARDRDSIHVLKIWTVGDVEFAFHATKGLRRRRA